jgi:uncharacterized protein
MAQRTLTIRGVPDPVLRRLRASARASRRSLNAELLGVLERAATERAAGDTAGTAGQIQASPIPGGVDRGALAAVCRRHHIRWLAVFGSRATGGARPNSDVDVVVEFEPGMTPGFGIVAVVEALRPVLGGTRVDLVTRRGLRSPLRERILSTAVPLHGA